MEPGDTSPTSEVLRLRRGIDWLDVEGEVVALDANRSVYLGTNASGTVLWRALAEGATTHRLAELLVDEFGIDPSASKRDVDAFVRSARDNGLLEE